MRVIVLHGEPNRDTFNMEDHQPIAEFVFDNDGLSLNDVLELAYQHTNNIYDSWSQAGSRDAHQSLKLWQNRPIYEGKEYGHRSSMVGDWFKVIGIGPEGTDRTFEVANFGFRKVW